MIDEEDLVEMYAAFEEGLHWDGEWTANLLIEYRELSTEVKRLRELLDAIHWDAFAEDDTTLEIDREVAERIRRGD